MFVFQSPVTELLWIQRLAILVLGVVATVIALYIPNIYNLFILAADIVFVIVLPQLTCALFVQFSNAYGAVCGFIVGVVLRVGAGEYFIHLDHFIKYPFFHDELGQIFPYRTFAMLMSFVCIILISVVTNFLLQKGILPRECDILNVCERQSHQYTLPEDIPCTVTDKKSCDQSSCMPSEHSSTKNSNDTNGLCHSVCGEIQLKKISAIN